MECPYCRNEIKSGWIRSSTNIVWSQTKTKFMTYQPGDLLISQSAIVKDNIPAYYCETCKRIFIELNDTPLVI